MAKSDLLKREQKEGKETCGRERRRHTKGMGAEMQMLESSFYSEIIQSSGSDSLL